MEPQQTAANYDNIATWWRERHAESTYGVDQLKRAISFVSQEKGKRLALDVGCGSSGRFIGVLQQCGFDVEGMDSSPEMIRQARETRPDCHYYVADIATWELPKKYDLISAWDSTFHLPIDLQQPALRRMCDGLAPGGVLLFTCGGSDEAGEIAGNFQDHDFEYGTLGIAGFLELLSEFGCVMRHLEFDQGPDEKHVYIIAIKGPWPKAKD